MKRWNLFLLFFLPFLGLGKVFALDTNLASNIEISNTYQYKTDQPELSTLNDSSGRFFIDKSKLRIGANMGLSLSKNYTYLGIGPQFGYQFNKYFMSGIGIKYYHWKKNLSNYEINDNLLGLNIFGYTYPVRFITMFVQPELNYIWTKTTYNTGDKETNSGLAPSLVVGAGLKLGFTHVTLNYDLIQHTNSPHPDGFYLGVSAFF